MKQNIVSPPRTRCSGVLLVLTFLLIFQLFLTAPVNSQDQSHNQSGKSSQEQISDIESLQEDGQESSRDKELLRFSLSDQYTRVVKENLRIFVNDSYRGFMYREQRAYLNELDPSLVSPREEAAAIGKNGKYYRGNVYLFKVMNRDNVNVAKPVDTEYRATISVDAAGRSAFADGEKVPLRTGFPSLPKEAVAVGETWQAEGVEHRLDEEGTFLEVPFRCNYTYKGRDEYQDRPVVVIGTSYTYRDLDSESNSNKTGLKLRGKIEGGIYLFTDSKGGYFIRERVERYLLGGAEGQRRESGFRLVWSEGFSREHIDAMEERIAEANNGAAGDGVAEEGGRGTEKEDEIEVSRSDEGVVLNLPNIHFEPDQAVILPEERSRLDKLAKLLRKVPEASFLVKGHTADVGSTESQIELSRERAKTIIDELAERGFAPTRFIYKGLGGSEPVASNETEEGRAKNRRVEIVVFSR